MLSRPLRLVSASIFVAALAAPAAALPAANGNLVFSSERDGNRDVFSTAA